MEAYKSHLEPLNLLVVVRRAPKLVLPSSETPRVTIHLPVVSSYLGFGSVLASHMLLFEGPHHHSFHHEGGQMRSPSPALVRGLEKVLSSYYPLAGRLRAPPTGADCSKLELICDGQGAVFVDAQANISLAELKKLDKVYWSELQYDFVGETSTEVPPLVIQVTNLTCGGFVLSVRVLNSLVDSAGILHFLHAWSELTKSSQNATIIAPLWSGIPRQLPHWPQKYHFPSLEFAQYGPEEYAHGDQHKLHYMEKRDQPYYDSGHGFSSEQKLHYMEKRDQPYYDNVQGLSSDSQLHYMESRDQPYYDNVHGLSNVSVSVRDLQNLKDSMRIMCNRFEVLAVLFWRERVRAMQLPQSSKVVLFFPAPVPHDVHMVFYGQYGFNCMLKARVGDLLQTELSDLVMMIQEAKAHVEENLIDCMRKFTQLHHPGKRAPPHVFIFTVLWDGINEVDFGTGNAPYAPDATRLHSLVNVGAVTGGLEDTIEIVMTNAPVSLTDKISHHLPSVRPLLSDSRL